MLILPKYACVRGMGMHTGNQSSLYWKLKSYDISIVFINIHHCLGSVIVSTENCLLYRSSMMAMIKMNLQIIKRKLEVVALASQGQ